MKSMTATRKFSVIIANHSGLPVLYPGSYTPDKSYPVLAISDEDDGASTALLIATDQGELTWVEINEVQFISIDD